MGIGSYVINLGYVCKIIAVFDNGDLLVENPRIGRWRACPDICTPYSEAS